MQMANSQLKIINIIMKMSWQHAALPPSYGQLKFPARTAEPLLVSLLLHLFISVLRRQKGKFQNFKEVAGAL